MEDKRKTITLDDIKTYLLKDEKKNLIGIPLGTIIICLIWIAASLLFKVLIWDILTAITFLLGMIGTTFSIINIKKIKNNTYFVITTDVLVNKVKGMSNGTWPGGIAVNRLFFKCNTYDILLGYEFRNDERYDLYDMDYQATFDTAFIGDTFTLIEIKKKVVLAFNNKLFNVIID